MKAFSVKNRRFCALLLLAVLALMQVRVAFAACEMASGGSVGAAPCCLEDGAVMDMHQGNADVPCLTAACAEQAALPQTDVHDLVASQLPPLLDSPPVSAALRPYPDRAASVSVSQTDAHPPHTRVIYVFQRLLI